MLIAYARVSTVEQDTALQVAAMRAAGVELYFEEQASGVKRRAELELVLTLAERGDVLVVYKVDRLRSLTEPIDTSTPAGRMIFQLLGVLAEFERSVILERCEAGRRQAMARGVRFGRKRAVCHERAGACAKTA